MSDKTKIRTADYTMNWWIGCTRVSEGCKNCYAANWVTRLKQRDFWTPTRTQTWKHPYAWQRKLERTGETGMVFCNSFSDFFHPAPVCDEWRAEAWRTMKATPSLVYRITTKRPENVARMLPPDWGEGYTNVWLGVTVESKKHLDRLDILRSIAAAARYAAMEPLLEDVTPGLDLDGISWVVCGGENERGCRPMDIQWTRNLRDLCKGRGIPFWYLGGGGGHQRNSLLDGALHEELPPWPGITKEACTFYRVLGHLASDDPAYPPLEEYDEIVLLLPGVKVPGARIPGGKVVSHAKDGTWRVYNSAPAYQSWAAGQSWAEPQRDFQAEVANLLERGQAGCATFVDFGGKWWVGCFLDDGDNWYEEFKANE